MVLFTSRRSSISRFLPYGIGQQRRTYFRELPITTFVGLMPAVRAVDAPVHSLSGAQTGIYFADLPASRLHPIAASTS